MEISYLDSEGKEYEVKTLKTLSTRLLNQLEAAVSPTPLRKQRQIFSHPKELIMGDKT